MLRRITLLQQICPACARYSHSHAGARTDMPLAANEERRQLRLTARSAQHRKCTTHGGTNRSIAHHCEWVVGCRFEGQVHCCWMVWLRQSAVRIHSLLVFACAPTFLPASCLLVGQSSISYTLHSLRQPILLNQHPILFNDLSCKKRETPTQRA